MGEPNLGGETYDDSGTTRNQPDERGFAAEPLDDASLLHARIGQGGSDGTSAN